ncbi:FdtA/QdtA family cupin domain-containing protein [Flavobacterium sp. H4147]|uniref:sugar 3,4-ketoisomerase n=1 Tax=unclassified Flavobacterium TaxID=196869 RepID=UPI0023EB3BB5|nr:FdtA/QdtA family cupin domain-containing protein [Flavobacterium sp. H4147]
MKTTIHDIQYIKFPVVEDVRGNLAFIQNDILPFEFKRIYYLFDIPSNAFRGGHSHIQQHEILVALSGSFYVTLDDGFQKTKILLNKPDTGLHLVNGLWRELEDFSSGAVCLVLSSDVFYENDYIRDYDKFLMSKK